ASGGSIASATCCGRSSVIWGMQELEELAQRSRAMADAVLLRRRKLGRGLAERRQQEQRVVTEAVGAARRARDLTAPDAFGNQWPRVLGRAHEDHQAAVIRRALGAQLRK